MLKHLTQITLLSVQTQAKHAQTTILSRIELNMHPQQLKDWLIDWLRFNGTKATSCL